MSNETNPSITFDRDEYPYQNGEVITQHWWGVFVFFAFVTSFVASYAAVRLLDHSLWRSEKEKEHASAIIITHPQAFAAVILGGGTVWSMHFVGMAAVTLDRTPMCYNWPVTLGSLVSAVAFMWAGVSIASRDIFRGPDRVQKLKEIVVRRKNVTAKGRHKQANRAIHLVALFYRPWHILAGAVAAATGALIMHYTGMLALKGAFQKHWSIGFVAGSVVLGVVVCCAGFLILFRLLLWKVEEFWFRPASAAVIALAVCTLHFFGMLSVTYTYDESLVGTCSTVANKIVADPGAWTPHQTVALAVALLVPSLALLVENMISRELFHAYCKLKNPALTVEYMLEAASRSRDSTVRRASINIKSQMGQIQVEALKQLSSVDDIASNGQSSAISGGIRRTSTASSFGKVRSCNLCDCVCHEPEWDEDEKAPPTKRIISSTSAIAPVDDGEAGAKKRSVSFTAGIAHIDDADDKKGKRKKQGSNASLPESFIDTAAKEKTESNDDGNKNSIPSRRVSFHDADGAIFSLEEGRFLSRDSYRKKSLQVPGMQQSQSRS